MFTDNASHGDTPPSEFQECENTEGQIAHSEANTSGFVSVSNNDVSDAYLSWTPTPEILIAENAASHGKSIGPTPAIVDDFLATSRAIDYSQDLRAVALEIGELLGLERGKVSVHHRQVGTSGRLACRLLFLLLGRDDSTGS